MNKEQLKIIQDRAINGAFFYIYSVTILNDPYYTQHKVAQIFKTNPQMISKYYRKIRSYEI